MKTRLDSDSPIPLYHQIAESIRYRIATGRLKEGDRLPGVREAAADFGVNLHTVRRAYGDLRDEGLVESRAALGTRVSARGNRVAEGAAPELDRFVRRVLEEAQRTHGIGAQELARRLLLPSSTYRRRPIWVVECSDTQCLDHAREIGDQLDVDVNPWSLEKEVEPPPGDVLATYFHHNEIRMAWPRRLADIHFLRIEPDRSLVEDPRLAGKRGGPVKVRLCEFEAPKAANIASDLKAVFPPQRLEVQECVVKTAHSELRASKERSPVLFPPRVWAALSDEDREDPRAIHVRYVLASGEIEALVERFQWPRRGVAR